MVPVCSCASTNQYPATMKKTNIRVYSIHCDMRVRKILALKQKNNNKRLLQTDHKFKLPLAFAIDTFL